jgi:hypothetical protein
VRGPVSSPSRSSALSTIGAVHLRRALLLFAIVLGLAALAAAISQPRKETPSRESPSPGVPSVAPGAKPVTLARVRFSNRGRARTRRLRAGRPALVTVAATTAGEASINSLGLTAPVEPRTPARFDVLVPEPGRHGIQFASASGGARTLVGTLTVVQAGTSSR